MHGTWEVHYAEPNQKDVFLIRTCELTLLITRWAPPLERSRLAAVAFSGSYVGTVIALPLSGVLAEHLNWVSTKLA